MSDEHNIIPYETLKASLDEATADMEAKETILLEAIHRQDPPLLMAIALHNFSAAYAKALARSTAVMREYGHLAEVTQNVQNQRDEINHKYESLKRTVNQLKKLNLDDGDANDKKEGDNPNDQSKKGKKRK